MQLNKIKSKLKKQLFTVLFVLTVSLVQAQISDLKGRVLDENQRPLEYVTVTLQNLDRIVFTDKNGNFSFPIPKKYEFKNYELKLAIVGKKTIETAIQVNSKQQLTIFTMQDLSLTLSEVQINQIRKNQNSNSSIIFDKQALEQIQAFSLADVLNNLPGKKTVAPQLHTPQLLNLRSEISTSGLQSRNNSFGIAIILDDIQLSNNANMQNNSQSLYGMGGASQVGSKKYGSFDTPFAGLDIRDIPVDNIENIEVITGVAPAKYGDLTDGAVIINRQAGKTPYQFITRINGASSNFSLSKGYLLNKKWGAINYSLNYLRSNIDPSDKTKVYNRVKTNLMWTSYLFKNFKNTLSFDYGTSLDDVKQDPDDGLELKTFAKSRSYSLSNRSSLELGGSLAKRIDLSFGYSSSYSESWDQQYINGGVKGIADKDVSGQIYEGYYIPGNYLAVEHVKGKPINMNGNLSVSNEIYTGKVLHKLSIGANLYYAQNHGQGTILDPTKPRWANATYHGERPYSYEGVPDVLNYGIYMQDNFKVSLFNRELTFNPGLRYDVQNGQGNLQPRINTSYALGNGFSLNAAYGISTKGPSLAHRYPSPAYNDITLLNKYTGYVNESILLVYTDKIIADNSHLKSSQSSQFEFGVSMNKGFITSSLFGYYKKNTNGFSDFKRFKTYLLPEYDYTYVQGNRPVVTPNGKYKSYIGSYVAIANDLNSSNYGLEWGISTKKIPGLQTSINLINSFSYSIFRDNNFRTNEVPQTAIEQGGKAWFAIYPPNQSMNWTAMTKISTTTHIPQLGFVLNLQADVEWQTIKKTLGDSYLPVAYLDKNLVRYEIPVFDPKNPDYNYLALSSAANSRLSLPFPVANLSARISKEIKKKIRFSVNANNLFNIKTQYFNPITNSNINYSTPTNVGAEISIKF